MGAVGYILKPAKREQLVSAFRLLEERLSSRTQIDPDRRGRRRAARRAHRALVVRGVDIVAVATAEDASREIDARPFDCVVLDLDAARRQRLRAARSAEPRRDTRRAAGDRLHRALAHHRRGAGASAPVEVDHHQRRALAGAADRGSDAVPASGGSRSFRPSSSICSRSRAAATAFSTAAACCWSRTTCAIYSR